MRYAYVICEMVDGLPSFRHEFVEASSEEEAYAKGQKTVRQPTGEGLNDYVFPCGPDTVGKPEYTRYEQPKIDHLIQNRQPRRS